MKNLLWFSILIVCSVLIFVAPEVARVVTIVLVGSATLLTVSFGLIIALINEPLPQLATSSMLLTRLSSLIKAAFAVFTLLFTSVYGWRVARSLDEAYLVVPFDKVLIDFVTESFVYVAFIGFYWWMTLFSDLFRLKAEGRRTAIQMMSERLEGAGLWTLLDPRLGSLVAWLASLVGKHLVSNTWWLLLSFITVPAILYNLIANYQVF